MTRLVALLLTTLTGMSGLVYEVAWQKVLATLLGSHSEATASVLALFLGGLSVGYWLFGRVTRTVVARAEASGVPPRLLFVYGAVELGIGLYVFVFPWLFSAVQALSFALPHGPAGVGFAVDVALAALLIGPPSILMGGTIPLLTQALSRSLDDATRFHALVYAFNTAGAFVGALAAGYYLVPTLGLSGVMRAMGCLNLFAGTVFVLLGRRPRAVVALEVPGGASPGTAVSAAWRLRVLSAVALLTGFAMMALQTIVIRVGGLSFGASQFTFSMVVAVFVLCIALGSFAVSALPRIPALVITANQWGLALLFGVLYFQIEEAPYRVYLLRSLFRDLDAGFFLYQLASFGLVLVAIGPAVLLSGASLPLLFHHLRQEVGHLGDLAGTLYSWNTVGSLLGALLGGYALLYWLDLHDVYRLALASLVVAAGVLTAAVHRGHFVGAALALPLLVVTALLPAWRPEVLTLGLFREREPRPVDWSPRLAAMGIRREREPNRILYTGLDEFLAIRPDLLASELVFHDDDPTATITVEQSRRRDGSASLSIITNGKNDSSTSVDYGTTALLGLVPALLADRAESAFVIGWGTGITVGELAALDRMRRIDVAEISPGVMRAAPLFDPYNHGALRDPRVRVVQSDAYRALMRSDQRYDLIVSEPSNPWVLGVELVYAREFLEAARDKLEPGGVYCQWIHTYEIDDATLALVLRTYADVFEHVAVWVANASDLMLLGLDSPSNATDGYRLEERAARPDFAAGLRRAGIESFPALIAHEVLPLGVVHALPRQGPLHTLLHPRLNDMAGRAFFRGARGRLPFSGFGDAARIGAERSLVRSYGLRFRGGIPDEERAALIREACEVQAPSCLSLLAEWEAEQPDAPAYLRVRDEQLSRMRGASAEEIAQMTRLFTARMPAPRDPITPEEGDALNEAFRELYLHAAPMSGDRLLDAWSVCRQGQRSQEECVESLRARSLGGVDDVDWELALEECMSAARVGRQCQVGQQSGEELVQQGRLPPPWEVKRRLAGRDGPSTASRN